MVRSGYWQRPPGRLTTRQATTRLTPAHELAASQREEWTQRSDAPTRQASKRGATSMRRLLTPTFGPSDWRRLLAHPDRQWRATKSAYELAVAWEAARRTARGLPADVRDLLDSTEEFRGSSLLLALPEHHVTLVGGGHASQTDLWALIDAPLGVVSVAVEAKAGEGFDRLVPEWLADAPEKSGKPARLNQLCEVLGIKPDQAGACRYQLLHRAVAAILEARRFHLQHALFLVHSFMKDPAGFGDYACFAQQLGVQVTDGIVVRAGVRHGVDLFLGWLTSHPADNSLLGSAV